MVAVVVAFVVGVVVDAPISLPLLLLSLSVLFVVVLVNVSIGIDTVLSVFDVANMLDAVLLSPSSPVVCRCSQAFFKCLGAVATEIE